MTAFTEARQAIFLKILADTPNITVAARAANVSRSTVEKHRKEDALFAERLQEALDEGLDLWEQECARRAFKGVERGVYHEGCLIDTNMHYSDNLATFLLKAHRPEKYRERTSVDVTGTFSLADAVREARERVAGG